MGRTWHRGQFHSWCVVSLLALSVGATAAHGQDSWDAIFIGGFKVGHNHIHVARVEKNGSKYQRVQLNTVLSFLRNGDRTQMELRYGTIETLDGAVLKLDTRTLTGRDEIKVAGDVVNGVMNLVMSGGGNQQEVKVPWGSDVRGPYGPELSLSREPLEPGQTRDIKVYLPDINRICSTHLDAKQEEKVPLGGGQVRTLLRVEQTYQNPDGKPMAELDTTFWVDKNGQILKSHSPFMGGTDMYRTTKEAALAKDDDFDLTAATIVKIARKIPNPERTRDVVYRVTVTGEEPKDALPTDRRQSVKPEKTRGRAILEVRTKGKDSGEPASAGPDAASLRPNPLVNSDDPGVIGHMRQAVGSLTDPWAKAVAIEEWVHKNIKKKNYSNAFASAREVAQDLEGDCSEHGVLTAAMCRAAGVPARCVVGFVYAEPLGGFGFHLWNEVFVNRRWVAIDSAFNQSEVDATHIKLAETTLDGVAPFEPFLPVIRLQGKLKIEALEVR